MMDKETLLQIMAALPESQLVQALSAAGIDVSGACGSCEGMGDHEPEEGLVSWDATKVEVPRTSRPPIADTSKLYAAQQAAQAQAAKPRPYIQQPTPAPNIAPFAVGME